MKEYFVWHRHLTVQVKHGYTLPRLCVLYLTVVIKVLVNRRK